MITRFETDDDSLVIESRRVEGGRTVWTLVVAAVLFPLFVVGEFYGLARLTSTDPALPPQIIGMVAVGFLVPLFFAPRLLRGWERIELERAVFVHEEYVGLRRTSRDEYDLLQMKGLRRGLTLGAEQVSECPGIGFWYRSGVRRFGDTLSEPERERVIGAMLDHDRRLRESLGMRPEDGLANAEWWDTPEAREAMLEELYTEQRYI